MSQKTQWPKVKWREKGPKIPAGGYHGLGFGWELHYYDFLHRWNGGIPSPDCFKVKKWSDEYSLARVQYFHGIYNDGTAYRDLRRAVYHTWNYLPRGSLPIASVDIEGDEWDLCTLLTFTWTDRYNKIYLLANPHDCGPHDPDDLSRLQLVANSLPQFLKQLKPYDYFNYRMWFQLSVPSSELTGIGALLTENGVEDWNNEFPEIEQTGCASAFNEEPRYTIWLGAPNSKRDGIKPPVKAAKDCSIMAIDAYRWNHDEALKHIMKLLKPLHLQRKIKKLGETPVIGAIAG